jgi:hypothetical protein
MESPDNHMNMWRACRAAVKKKWIDIVIDWPEKTCLPGWYKGGSKRLQTSGNGVSKTGNFVSGHKKTGNFVARNEITRWVKY